MNRAYWMESKMELLKMVRLKQYSLSTVAFPLMFYCFFGLAMAPFSQGATSMSKYLLATSWPKVWYRSPSAPWW